jgi:hypothetical protein
VEMVMLLLLMMMMLENLEMLMCVMILAPPLIGECEEGREDQCHEGERERKRNGNWLLQVLRIVRSSFVLNFAA